MQVPFSRQEIQEKEKKTVSPPQKQIQPTKIPSTHFLSTSKFSQQPNRDPEPLKSKKPT
jgi:hypothetical protein